MSMTSKEIDCKIKGAINSNVFVGFVVDEIDSTTVKLPASTLSVENENFDALLHDIKILNFPQNAVRIQVYRGGIVPNVGFSASPWAVFRIYSETV